MCELEALRVDLFVKPTDAILPPARASLLWRLASQLSLNYLSLVSEGADAFREILKLHNFGNSLTVDRQKQGLDGAMQTILAQPFGKFLLTAAALGFVAFGVFAILQSRYRRM